MLLVPAIALAGDGPIATGPEGQAEGNVHQRREWPESWQPAGQIAKSRSSAQASAVAADQIHLLHQLVVGKVGVTLGDQRIVKREERQPSPTVPTRQPFDLPRAELAMAVVDHHLRTREIVGMRQSGGAGAGYG